MSNNTTTINTYVYGGYEYIWIYLVWIFYFFCIALPNLLVVITVVRYKALRDRKEYIMMSGLCFVDFWDITNGATMGLRRIILIYRGLWNTKISVWSCVVTPLQIGYWVTPPLTAIMLCVLSVDRLMCVAAPITYYKLQKRYAHRMVGTAYVFCMLGGLLCLILAYNNKDDQQLAPAACFMGGIVIRATNKYYAAYNLSTQPIGALVSVGLYLCVGVAYWKKKQTSIGAVATNQQQEQERARQRKFSKSIALSCVCTTLFLIIPLAILRTVDFLPLPRLVNQALWMLGPMNPLANVIIFVKRQKVLRKGMKALFRNKDMPPTVELWQA